MKMIMMKIMMKITMKLQPQGELVKFQKVEQQ